MAPRLRIALLAAACAAVGCDAAPAVWGRDAQGHGARDADAQGRDARGDDARGDDAAEPDASYPPYAPARPVAVGRRLSNDEIRASWHDLLGSEEASTDTDLPPDPVVLGFDNNADALVVSAPYLERYATEVERRVAAVQWARDVGPRLPSPCAPAAADDACMRSFVEAFGRRAFRRPLQPQEEARFLGLARLAGGDAEAAARAVLSAMLESPHFLYLVEQASEAPPRGGRYRLDGYGLAARMAYLLWSTAPDEALLDRAARGELDDDAGLARATAAMLADPRARAGLGRFFRKWLRLEQTAFLVRGMGDFPQWRPEFGAYYAEETARFVDELAWRDGANFLDLVSAQWTWVNGPLADLYGFPPGTVQGPGWARVTFPPSADRSGVLTHASVLAITSGVPTPSPTRRGEFVRAALLCQSIPAPPAAAALVHVEANVDARGRAALYAANPTCASCHALMDPVGFGLERFNPIGAWGMPYSPTSEFSGRGRLEGFTPPEFTGAAELGARLRASDAFAACVATQFFRFAFARGEGAGGDDATLAAVTARFRAAGFGFRDLVTAVVLSDGFRTFEATPDADGGTP